MTIDLGVKTLNADTLERLLIIAERNVRKYLYSQVESKDILDLNISVEINQENTLSIDIEVEAEIHNLPEHEIKFLIENAIDKADQAIGNELKNLART
ncbi:MAG: DUF3194 domain-containing protein [Candidatus Helarchaeota archaeon]